MPPAAESGEFRPLVRPNGAETYGFYQVRGVRLRTVYSGGINELVM